MTAAHWPVIGHEWAVFNLDRAVSDDRPAHAYLIGGPPHIGKTTLAAAMAHDAEVKKGGGLNPLIVDQVLSEIAHSRNNTC
jgi:DNA polymerase III gamma/tau subunit